MILLRKTNQRNSGKKYQERAIIRIAKSTQAKFIVSRIIAEKLKIDIEKEALMFGIKDKKLHVFKEEKESDNYHLGVADTHTYRFRSIELYNFLSDFYKKPKEKEFYIEMSEDFTFCLVNIA